MKQQLDNHNSDHASCDPAELFRTLAAPVYGYAMKILGSPADAEDVLSETFVRICKKRDQYHGRGRLRAWVFSIAHRLCIDVLRRKAKLTKPVSLPQQLASANPSPTVLTERHERQTIIVAAVEKLPPQQKEVIMLKIYGGLTFREISETLRIPLNTALGRMHQALKRLARDPSLEKIERT